MNELEKHILKNRSELDKIEKPDIKKMWAGIEVRQHKAVGRSRLVIAFRKLAVAASFMLLGGVAVWMYLHETETQVPTQVADFYPELKTVQLDYQKTIAQKVASIPFDSLDQTLFADILGELQELEGMHQEVLKDLPQYTKNDRIVDALMRYYERKLQILERISNEYQKNKRHEKRKEIQL